MHKSSQAVLDAYKRKGIITDNLEQHFREAIAQRSDPSYYNAMLSASFTASGAKKFSGQNGRSVSAFALPKQGYDISRVFEAPHNPFRNRLAVETPQSLIELYQRYRYYFRYEPLVGTAIELHSEFPLSTFQLQHDDPTLQQEFNDICEDIKLSDFLLDMAHEYWLLGTAFPFGILDNPKDPSVWKSFILLDPLSVHMQQVPITDGRPNTVFSLQVSKTISEIVARGPRDPQTGELYNRIPQDIIDACKCNNTENQGKLKLNSIQVSCFKRKGSYFDQRGQSILDRIMHLLSYRDKLRDSSYSVADRHASPREVWKVGSELVPATEDELAALAGLISNSYNDPNQAIVWHHALQVDIIGAADKVLPLRQELDAIEEEMLIGLMLNKGFLDSNYGAYANMSVSLDVLINRYMSFRQRVEEWMRDHVWSPICRIHNIYKPSPAELSHRIRIKNAPKRPWTPKVAWDKSELRDPTQKVQLLLQLREKLGDKGMGNGFPSSIIYQAAGYDPNMIKRQLRKEAKEGAANKTQVNIGGGPSLGGAGPGGGVGLPDLSLDAGGLGDSSAPAGGPTGGNLDIPDAALPEFNGVGPNNTKSPMPPDSQKIQNQNSPTS